MKQLFVIMFAALAFVACQEEKKAEPTTEQRMESYLNDLYEAAENCEAEEFMALTEEFEEYLLGLSNAEFAKAEEFAIKWREENVEKTALIDDCMIHGVPEVIDVETDEYYDEAMENAEEYYDEAMENAEEYYDEAMENAEEYYDEAMENAEEYYDEAMENAEEYYDEAIEAVEATEIYF